MPTVNYDALSTSYARHRRPDPRIAAQIVAALGDARRILNVGAGTGSYEPQGRKLVALDASYQMLARRGQRDGGAAAAPAIQARAEALPFADGAFDAAMAILSLHHWQDQRRGLAEMRRVAPRRVVLLTWVGFPQGFWLLDYIPQIQAADANRFPTLDTLEAVLGPLRVETVPIPRDCRDGLLCAYWARPALYLDASARRAISVFARMPEPVEGLRRLAADLRSGRWQRRYGAQAQQSRMDFGYRLVLAGAATADG